ncbi:MAG: VanW family protein [Actinomycetota bacterium]
MRNALLAVAAVLLAFLAGWLIDDKLLGGDVPRNRSVAGVDVGKLDLDEARERLAEAGLADREIGLSYGGAVLTATGTELGVSATLDAALAAARERPSLPLQPISWIGSLFRGADEEVSFEIDSSTVGTFLATEADSFFDLDFGRPQIELVDGEFVETDAVSTPVVDIEALEALILEAMTSENDVPTVEIPIGGEAAVDRGADALIAEASALTEDGLFVVITGSLRRRHIPETALREWVVFGGTADRPTIELDEPLVQSTLETLFIGFGESGSEPTFWVDENDEVYIRGNTPGSVCCTLDSPERILTALQDGATEVELSPREDPDVRGVAWAESLGIVEVVGEFTTNYVAGQSRTLNIQRIAELTQGVIIEPGGEFSINDFVGRRTTEKGFVSAGVIQNGVFKTSVGGGISQYATTLFNAAFFAGLDYGEYQAHSIYIDRYPYGREATVNWQHPDLEIINNTPYGILLWPTTDSTSITVQLFSTKWVEGEQTGQSERREGVSCTRVTTERTRTWVEDGRTEIDYVTARYRPEGRNCDGSDSDPDPTTTTTSTVPPSTSVP